MQRFNYRNFLVDSFRSRDLTCPRGPPRPHWTEMMMINIRNRSLCCSVHFTWSCRSEKIMSMVDRPARKPYRLSCSMPVHATWSDSLISMVRTRTLPATESNDIRRRLSQFVRSPFCLVEVHYGCIFEFLCHRFFLPDESVESPNLWARGNPLFVSDFIARWTSCSVGGTASARMGACLPLRNLWQNWCKLSKVVGWLNTESKCSIQRFIISDWFNAAAITWMMSDISVYGLSTRLQCGRPNVD